MVGTQGKEIEDAILCVMREHPEYAMTYVYDIVQPITTYPRESIRRVKSTLLKKYKNYVILLSDAERLEDEK